MSNKPQKPPRERNKQLTEALSHFVWLFNNVIDDQIDKGDLRDRLIEQCEKATALLEDDKDV